MYNVFELPEDFLNREYTDQEKQKFDQAIHDAINTQVNEELTPEQKEKVDRWWKVSGEAKHAQDKVFGESERIVLPYDESQDEPITNDNYHTAVDVANLTGHVTPPHYQVFQALDAGGYRTDDYVAGTAYKADDPKKRPFGIRSVLGRLGVADKITSSTTKSGAKMTLGQVYDADPVRAAARKDKQIVITRNPYDVVGMSTGRCTIVNVMW